ncbi:hypothetical protein [Sinorhizobium chiapasense]|uniref:Uncharacterized protein n=1 Tax=Sinorhizobium chiapasense TaxID=501572 RepID=A0ABZ2BDR4_9HYPH
MSAPQPSPVRVTYHAVTRYVQRIIGLSVPGTWQTEKAGAEAHAAAAGMTIDEVRALIWTRGVELSVRCGFTRVANQHFLAQISQPAGVVTTVCAPHTRENQSRMKVYTERELKQRHKRMTRRLKRRPAVTDAAVHGAIHHHEDD